MTIGSKLFVERNFSYGDKDTLHTDLVTPCNCQAIKYLGSSITVAIKCATSLSQQCIVIGA